MLFDDCEIYSLEGPFPILNLDKLTMQQCININDNWGKIIKTMEPDVVEKLKDLPTETLRNKIDFIGEYMEVTCE